MGVVKSFVPGKEQSEQMNQMVFTLTMMAVLCAVIFAGPSHSEDQSWRNGAGHLRLVDDLDRPQDGYCLDVVGSGQHIRFDLPLIAHNCKPGLYADEAVVFEKNGNIRFPAYDKCATVAGLNSRALPGAALVPRDCGENSPFLNTKGLQEFHKRDDGRIELEKTGLCLTVGAESASTFSADHRWRPLFVETCGKTDGTRSKWTFAVPK